MLFSCKITVRCRPKVIQVQLSFNLLCSLLQQMLLWMTGPLGVWRLERGRENKRSWSFVYLFSFFIFYFLAESEMCIKRFSALLYGKPSCISMLLSTLLQTDKSQSRLSLQCHACTYELSPAYSVNTFCFRIQPLKKNKENKWRSVV